MSLDPITELMLCVMYEKDIHGDGLTAAEIAPILKEKGVQEASNGLVQVRLLPLERRGLVERVAGDGLKRTRVSDRGARYLRENGHDPVSIMPIWLTDGDDPGEIEDTCWIEHTVSTTTPETAVAIFMRLADWDDPEHELDVVDAEWLQPRTVDGDPTPHWHEDDVRWWPCGRDAPYAIAFWKMIVTSRDTTV